MTDQQGHLVGVDVTLAKEIAAQLGVKLQFVRTATTFDAVIELVKAGDADTQSYPGPGTACALYRPL